MKQKQSQALNVCIKATAYELYYSRASYATYTKIISDDLLFMIMVYDYFPSLVKSSLVMVGNERSLRN